MGKLPVTGEPVTYRCDRCGRLKTTRIIIPHDSDDHCDCGGRLKKFEDKKTVKVSEMIE